MFGRWRKHTATHRRSHLTTSEERTVALVDTLHVAARSDRERQEIDAVFSRSVR